MGGSLQRTVSLIVTVLWDLGRMLLGHQSQVIKEYLLSAGFNEAVGEDRTEGSFWL